ncbi:hypothetical protein B0H19DRAFT_1079313 [Mycena capillaripes]|nr:hypothetical protein B0H19DRAFT_1079313 [Mycena capillaripes]
MHPVPFVSPVLSPPPLPELRQVEFSLNIEECTSLHLEHGLMVALDDGLIAHPASPVIIWSAMVLPMLDHGYWARWSSVAYIYQPTRSLFGTLCRVILPARNLSQRINKVDIEVVQWD